MCALSLVEAREHRLTGRWHGGMTRARSVSHAYCRRHAVRGSGVSLSQLRRSASASTTDSSRPAPLQLAANSLLASPKNTRSQIWSATRGQHVRREGDRRTSSRSIALRPRNPRQPPAAGHRFHHPRSAERLIDRGAELPRRSPRARRLPRRRSSDASPARPPRGRSAEERPPDAGAAAPRPRARLRVAATASAAEHRADAPRVARSEVGHQRRADQRQITLAQGGDAARERSPVAPTATRKRSR